MASSKYTFEIVYQGQTSAVKPTNFHKNKFDWSRKDGEIFFRHKYNGAITFDKDGDFDFFWNIEKNGDLCEDIYFNVRKCGSLYWKGVFSTGAGKFDLDRCTFEVQPQPYDRYHCFLKALKNEFDVLQLPISEFEVEVPDNINGSIQTMTRVDVELISSTVIHSNYEPESPYPLPPYFFNVGETHRFIDGVEVEVTLLGEPTAAYLNDSLWCISFDTNTTYQWNFDVASTGQRIKIYNVRTRTYKREIYSTQCVSGSCDPPAGLGWTLLSSDCGSLGTCTYWKCINTVQTREHNRKINDVLGYVVDQLDCPESLTIRSIFLGINPDINDEVYIKFSNSGTDNYVTGAVSWTQLLMIAQKSDYTMPHATNPALHGLTTLERVFYWLNKMFGVYWDINTSGELIIEHEFYFDFHAPTYSLLTYKKEQEGKNVYEHNSVEIPEEESFSFMENDPDKYELKDFQGTPIKYKSVCSNSEANTSTVIEDLTTNIEFIDKYPDAISDDGFVMIATSETSPGVFQINNEQTLWTLKNKNNGHLSWPNLQHNYLRYGRYMSVGEMNGLQTRFLSWRPNIKQVAIEINWCCADGDFDPRGKFITTLATKYLSTLIDCSFSSGNLIINPNFSGSAAGWNLGTGWAYGSDDVVHSFPAGFLEQTIGGLVAGQVYNIGIRLGSIFGGTVEVSLGGGAITTFVAASGGNGYHQFQVIAGSAHSKIQIRCDASLRVDDVSLDTLVCSTKIPFARVKSAELDILKEVIKIVFEYAIWQR